MDKSESVVIQAQQPNKILEDSEEVGLSLLCSDFSPCGSKFAFCTLAKNLCIVDISQTNPILISVHQLSRGASKVKFTPHRNCVLVADKSGDVFLFNPKKGSGDLILGHLSMLLDVLVTPDEQFIITCDRDEKIRVSYFPNAYNIVAYCLGHTEFVSSVSLLPHNMNYLISTSGDGTVRLWDYKIGSELLEFNFNSHMQATTDEDADLSAITDASTMAIDDKSSLICVCVAQLNTYLVLKCTSSCEPNSPLEFTVIQELSFQFSSPWKLFNQRNLVWLLVNQNDNVSLKAIVYNHESCQFSGNLPDYITKALNTINSEHMTIDYKKNVLRLLFKKKFDNVQEYLKKKDARLALDEPSIKKIKQ